MQTPKQVVPNDLQETQAGDRPMGTGRRTFVRYPVVMDAALIDAEGRETPCVMRDFCMGGMLLHFREPVARDRLHGFAANDTGLVRCVVPMSGGDKLIEFQIRVARAVQGGVGIAFINPQRDALQIMQQFALQFSADGEKEPGRPPQPEKNNADKGLFGRRFSDVLAGCERIVQETMDSLLDQLGAKLSNRLFELSRDTVNPQEQNAYFNASELIKKNDEKFANDVRADFNERLRSGLKKSVEPKKSPRDKTEEVPLENLSLVGDEDLGVWLAVSDVADKVEERFKEALATLDERLCVLFKAKIDRSNNPYGPVLFAESFQAGLSQFNFKEFVNVACYAVLKETLISLLADLYVRLNEILAEHGILPELTYAMLRRSALQKSKSRVSVVNDVSAKKTGDHVSQDLYQVVQDLRALRQDLARQKGLSLLGSSGAAPDEGESSDYYSTSELMGAVADLQIGAPGLGVADDPQGDVKSRVLAALAAQGGGGKNLNPRDGNILEVAEDLLGAIRSDPLVADSVKPWLERLELPVLKQALLDPSLFFDHSHVARQVVNNIAQLEFYRNGQADAGHGAMNAAIEGLLEKIAIERSDGTEIFGEILVRLDKFVKIQNTAYADNLKDVVAECREKPPQPDDYDPQRQECAAIPDEETHKWISHAQRLRAGDNVLHVTRAAVPQKLRVAWMDDRRSLYVFVNLRGIREKTLKVEDVARMMRSGVLEPQANAADPAMDRAQYVIMQDLYQQVLHESTHDSLTGLINRREFERRLGEAVASAKREDLRHALLFVDIDKFSAINNSCGYAGGDRLLQNLVSMLKADLDGGGEIARLGSDQFGILIERCSLDDALAVAEQQIERVADYRLAWDDSLFSVTLSMGLVPISARSGNVGELLQSAESSCNIAKDTGGNRLQVFHAGHSRIAHRAEVMKWIGRIDKILEQDELMIRCQRIEPIAGDGAELPSFEILAAIKDEQGNIGSAIEFIKAAEWYRRMPAVDRYIIKKTFSWIDRNPEAVERAAGFFINLSGQSINEEGFVDFILAQLEGLRAPREKIRFEVTETVGVSNLSNASLFIESVKDAGCGFALDDFGSGMSSYGYLKNLPVDIVKIDGVFVQNLVADSSDYVVVRSITEIAHFMNKKVIAEFVENAEALALLREIGVDYAQGYMLDRPDSLERLLVKN